MSVIIINNNNNKIIIIKSLWLLSWQMTVRALPYPRPQAVGTRKVLLSESPDRVRTLRSTQYSTGMAGPLSPARFRKKRTRFCEKMIAH